MENRQHNVLLFFHIQSLKQMSIILVPKSSPCFNFCASARSTITLPNLSVWKLKKHYNPQSMISSAHKFSLPYLALIISLGWTRQLLRSSIKVRLHGFMGLNIASWFYWNSQVYICVLNIFRAGSVLDTSSNPLCAYQCSTKLETQQMFVKWINEWFRHGSKTCLNPLSKL